MDVVLVPEPDAAIAEAVRTSAVREGVSLAPVRSPGSAWWRAGVLEARQRSPRPAPAAPAAPGPSAAFYEAAPPRRTRGATRA